MVTKVNIEILFEKVMDDPNYLRLVIIEKYEDGETSIRDIDEFEIKELNSFSKKLAEELWDITLSIITIKIFTVDGFREVIFSETNPKKVSKYFKEIIKEIIVG
jgi:hypothetical protein